MEWNLIDLLMVIDDRDSLNKSELRHALVQARRILIQMNKDLRLLLPIKGIVERIARDCNN